MAPYTLPPRDVSPFAAAEVEAYAREKDLDGLFRALMSRVFRERPSDPVDFVFAELAERYPDRAAARGWTTLAPNRSPPDHPDRLRAITTPSRDDDSVPTPEREKDEQSRPDSDPSPLAIPGANLARRHSVPAECVTARAAASVHLPATTRSKSRMRSGSRRR